MIPKTASTQELVWTASMAVALLAVLISWGVITYKYYLFRKPDSQGVRGNGAGTLLFIKDTAISVLLTVLTLGGTLLGVAAMGLPEPVRAVGREQNEMIANLFIVGALGIAAYALGNLWLLWRIDKKIRQDRKKKNGGAK